MESGSVIDKELFQKFIESVNDYNKHLEENPRLKESITVILLEKEFKRVIERTGIEGFCSCCGKPYYVGKDCEHDKECIWE